MAALTATAWALITAGGAIINGHPSYVVFYAVVGLLGIVSLVRGSRRGFHRRWTVIAGGGCLVILAAVAWWLTPFSADDVALEALQSSDYSVADTSTAISMSPDSASGPGVIFQPGARVDARAYAHILAGLVEQGHPVVIVKQPLGIGFLATGFPASWAEQHPESAWVVAGHSLGGVAAADAAEDLDGLVLWASFPASDLPDEIAALSVFGTNDTFTTPEDIEATSSRLPAAASFVAIEGGIHSYFGDYRLQPGDGVPEVTRDTAQAEIVAATIEFLEQIPVSR